MNYIKICICATLTLLTIQVSAQDLLTKKEALQIALENMMKNRTSIVIAHRLSTIQNADEIVVLQKGKIVEKGTHDELILKSGIYKRLVDMQSFG